MNASFARDERPIDADCDCYACLHFSRAYLRHLISAGELLAGTLLSMHNLRALIRLVADVRVSILEGSFQQRLPAWLSAWNGNAARPQDSVHCPRAARSDHEERFMSLLYSILFGLVEGLTEFVPVSSTAHMLLLQRILAIPASADMFSLSGHCPTGRHCRAARVLPARLLAAGDLILCTGRSRRRLNRQAWFVVLATIPALLAGFLLKDVVQGSVRRPPDGGRDPVPYGRRLAQPSQSGLAVRIDRWNR